MCGLAGILGRPDPALLARMSGTIIHRGPDDSGYYNDGTVGLASRRLSIIDLAGGHQPLSNEDGTIWVSYNGEVYNHDELRRKLEKSGHKFRTHCDTEAIVHAYEEYGVDCLDHLDGMFAFAVWDSGRRRLMLARDRVGIKPLYYAELPQGGLVFGSELRALVAHPDVDRTLNLRALGNFLVFGYVPPPDTVYSGVRALLPGHMIVSENGRLECRRYWDVRIEPETDRGLDVYREEFRELFRECVRKRLMSDVPLGAFLSGGIDSSSVVAEMRSIVSGPVTTFTIGFADFARRFDETDDARLVAKSLGTEHHEWMLTERDVIDGLPRLIDHFEQPCATGIPTYFVSQLAREHVTVALAGIGGDELFAGYPRHVGIRLLQRYRRIPRFLHRGLIRPVIERLPGSVGGVNLVRRAQLMMRSAELDELGQYLVWSAAIAENEVHELLRPEVAEQTGSARDLLAPYLDVMSGRDFADKVLYLDLKTYMPFDLLELTDKLSMAHSLEIRVPYCDHRLVEFAARLPYRHKLRHLTGKFLVRRAFAQDLPARVFNKPKQGFSVPMGLWIQRGLRPLILDCLSEETIERRGLLNPSVVRRMLDEHVTGERDWTYRLWTLAALELFMRRYDDARA